MNILFAGCLPRSGKPKRKRRRPRNLHAAASTRIGAGCFFCAHATPVTNCSTHRSGAAIHLLLLLRALANLPEKRQPWTAGRQQALAHEGVLEGAGWLVGYRFGTLPGWLAGFRMKMKMFRMEFRIGPKANQKCSSLTTVIPIKLKMHPSRVLYRQLFQPAPGQLWPRQCRRQMAASTSSTMP